jgi:hypothetical protein
MTQQELLNRTKLQFPQRNRAEELLNLPRLSKNDTFNFGCNECGACCRDREDILLTPFDVFRIAKHLKMSIHDMLEEYCESYEGASSRIPVVRIKPKPYRNTCPFSKKGRCLIHAVKPGVCALFPLGRMTDYESKELHYILQPATCGNTNQTQTVRQWLENYAITDSEDITVIWHMKTGELSEILRKVYKKIDFKHDVVNSALIMTLYLAYDLEQDFMPQFTANCDEAVRIAKFIAEKSITYIEVKPNG